MVGCCRTFGVYAHGVDVNAAGDVFLAEMGPDGLTKMERIIEKIKMIMPSNTQIPHPLF